MFEGIPHEMRGYPQWVAWRYEDLDSPKPTKVPYSARNGKLASVTDAGTWSTYEEALEAVKTGFYSGLGFVLTDADPYAFIDLDDAYEMKPDGTYKHADPQATFDRQLKIYNEFQTFAEKSPSGKGLHLILKGAVESGRRRSSIEVYSSHRYMTMTGDVYRDLPIAEDNGMLQVLWGQMGEGKSAAVHYAGLSEATETDEQVIATATNASNGEKFAALYTGDWQSYYPSQSEADLALINIVAFYTQNRAQIARIFRGSGLGQRDKAKRNDYVSYMLNKSFDQTLPPVDVDGLKNLLEARMTETARLAKERESSQVLERPVSEPAPELKPASPIYNPPPGLVGDIARFIYAQAPRPVPEIALAGAIGLMAGIVGRAYNVSGTGLNQYVLLLAPTGTGKEAIARGVNKLMGTIAKSVPSSVDFLGPAEIASAQALNKYLSKSANSFVSMIGEFGIQLKMMASPNAPPHLMGLQRTLLDLYHKSGEGDVMQSSIYSDRDKNTASVHAPAVTLLCESTPEKFYEALDESMISSGLLPRFTSIEYTGPRPALNPGHVNAHPSFDVIERLGLLCANALTLNSQNKAIQVTFTEDARQLFADFDKDIDARINSADRELRRHLWNRAHVKAMKLAALIAVGIHPYEPKIDAEVAQWSMNLVTADVRNVLHKFDAGEIGMDNEEGKQVNALIQVIRDYVKLPFSEVEKYIPGQGLLHGERIIPYAYMQRRLASISVFRKDKRGASEAIKRTLKTLCERGDIQEVSKAVTSKKYDTVALCYMIAVPRALGL